MTHRALLLGLLLALPAPADDSPTETIDEAALETQFKELNDRLEQLRNRAVTFESFLQYYKERALATKGTPKERAVSAFLHAFVLHKIALQMQNTKDPKEAKREYQRALELYPGFLPAYAELALLAERAGDRAEAERLLQRAIEIKRKYVRAWVQLAQMALRQGELERAKELFAASLEFDTVVDTFAGLIAVNTALFQRTFDEKEKEKYAREALDAADAVVTFQPNAPKVRLIRAQVLQDLGRTKDACDYLEGLYAEGSLEPEAELEVLWILRGLYQMQRNVDGVRGTIDRLLKCKGLRPEDRARVAGRKKDIDEMQRHAFVKWEIEDAIQILKNPGLSVEHRVSVLRALIGFCTSEAMAVPALRPLIELASHECFRMLTDPTPELIVTQLRALRNGGPPARLMAVLVHFVYPKGISEEVREEGCRIVAAAGGQAAIPALYYSLQDPSGRVVREADAQLSLLCERRSPFGGSIEPLTDEQRTQALRNWTTYFHSEEGSLKLAKAFEQLSGCVLRVNPDLTAAPMIDHAANILRDGDVAWTGWSASYAFLVSYWGKDFRPVGRRGKQVEPFEREAIVAAFEQEFNPPEPPPEEPPAKQPPATAGMKGK